MVATTYRACVGGTESYLARLVPRLAADGHAVGLLHERTLGSARETVDPPDHEIPTWCADDMTVEEAVRALREWQLDLVFAQGLSSPVLESCLVRAFPAILFAHNYHGTCATGTKRHAFPHLATCRRRFGPACLGLHYPRRCGGLSPVTAILDYQRQRTRNELLKRYRAIVVASGYMRDEFARHGVPGDRLRVIPYPVIDRPILDSPPLGPSDTPNHVVFVARLTDLKGGMQLIHALHRASAILHRRLYLTVAGAGPAEPTLRRLAGSLRIDTTFSGWLDRTSRDRLLGSAHLIAVPSVWPEPFGIVGVEAGARGVPAVAYDVGGIRGWLEPGVNGEIAPGDPPTIQGLAQALIRALASPTHYAKLRNGARQTALRFTDSRHLAALVQLFHEVA